MQDRALVGDGHEVALVVGGALAEVLQVAGDVDGAHEHVGVLEVLEYSTPTRDIRIMCSTTVRVSVSWTPAAHGASAFPGGAIR